ncbi:hypothetical protein FZEAL_10030 [Fusarium zealandicum]|uniref:Uncharacterized protein n=1 Tax=Fusarium zealandicum TaxID=1053134 RepID=A0A8H4U650_9HYPO|nr:hypothetical protein FZEAL_10030 [Fusarium zealandicum]
MASRQNCESVEMTTPLASPLRTTSEEEQPLPKPVDASSKDTMQASPEQSPPDTENTSASDHRDQESRQTGPTCHECCPLEKHVLYSIVTVVVFGCAALAAACWLVAYIQNSNGSYIQPEIITGTFSITSAKLIDAASSMLIAPAIIAVANWHMFKLARLCAVNEHPKRNSAASLNVLVESAITDWGSTSPFKFWALLRSQKPRIMCLGAIALLSALNFTFLGNVIAYESGAYIMKNQDLD